MQINCMSLHEIILFTKLHASMGGNLSSFGHTCKMIRTTSFIIHFELLWFLIVYNKYLYYNISVLEFTSRAQKLLFLAPEHLCTGLCHDNNKHQHSYFCIV